MKTNDIVPEVGFSVNRTIQFQRMKQFVVATMCALIVGFFNELINTVSVNISLILAAALMSLAYCLFLIKKGEITKCATHFVWTNYIMLSLLIWLNSGLKDPAIFGYAGLLVFAAFLGTQKQFYWLLLSVFTSIVCLAVTWHFQWIEFIEPGESWVITTNILAILSVVAFSVKLLVFDMRTLIFELNQENTKVLASKKAMARIAHTDTLTNLPNRLTALKEFDREVEDMKSTDRSLSLILIDVDSFKSFNDALGHDVGDEILKQLATRLLGFYSKKKMIFRISGNQFLLISQDKLSEDLSFEAQRLLQLIAIPIQIEQHNIALTASIGISNVDPNNRDFDASIKKAETAMYQAKDKGRNTFKFYDQAMDEIVKEQVFIASNLRNAMKGSEFKLHYQPIVRLRDKKVVSAEALLRWDSPEVGIISPDKFIPIAERTGLILDLGRWVLEQSCAQCKAWHLAGFEKLSVSVNVSTIQFKRGDLVSIIDKALEDAELHPSFLKLEITESLLVDEESEILPQIKSLRSKGISVAIDDFGTGYSSLAYLQNMKVDNVKIDRGFLAKMSKDPLDNTLLEAIILLGSKMKLKLIAEGIEYDYQYQFLLRQNCDYGQGYLFSKPLSKDDFFEYLNSSI